MGDMRGDRRGWGWVEGGREERKGQSGVKEVRCEEVHRQLQESNAQAPGSRIGERRGDARV